MRGGLGRGALGAFVLLAALPFAASARPARKPAKPRAPAASASRPAQAPAAADATTDEPMAPDDVRVAAADTAAPPAATAPAPPPAAKPAPESPSPAEPKDTPAPAPPGAATPAPSIDLQKLRADYDRLRDDLYRARARAQIVQEGIYSSRLAATLRWKGAPDYVIKHAEVRIDGGSVWDSGDKPVTDDLVKVAERPVKAGAHALTVRLEIRLGAIAKNAEKTGGKDPEQLGYVSEHTFAIIVPDGKHVVAAITGDEDGDPPEYEPEIEIELETGK
jgi:hypothetical protein